MKALLGAAAAVSGVGTLVYLLARSGRRRDTGQPTTPSDTPHAPQKQTSATVIEKEGSYEQLNGHLPCTATTKDVMLGDADVTLHNDTCDVSAVVGGISSDAPQLQNKTPGVDDHNSISNVEVNTQQVRVKADVTQKTSDCVHLQSHSKQDDLVMTQEKDIETTQEVSNDAVTPSKDSETHTELTTICKATNDSTLLEATCESKPIQKPIETPEIEPRTVSQTSNDLQTEPTLPPAEPITVQQTSNNLQTESTLPPAEPVVEELSQCLISKPQCDPMCCEHLIDTCHNTCPKDSTSETTGTSLNETGVTLGGELSEHTLESNLEEQHYTLVLKSDNEEVCISGKHLPDPSPAELPADLPAELNEEEKMTSSLATEQEQKECSVNESVLIHSDRKDSCSETVTGEDNDNTVKSTPQEPNSGIDCPVKIEITLCPDEELNDSEEEDDNKQEENENKEEKEEEGDNKQEENENKEEKEEEGDNKQEQNENKEEEITQEEKVNEKKEENGNKQEIIQNKEQDDIAVKQECAASNVTLTEQQEKSNSEDVTTKQEESDNSKQEITKEEKQISNEEEATKKQEEECNSKQENNEKQEEEGSKEENKIKEEENKNQSTNQEITQQQQQQSGDQHDIKTTNESTVEIVTVEQIVNSPLKNESVKKGGVRTRGDSASADLDCDLGSEQDNLNCDASSLVNVM